LVNITIKCLTFGYNGSRIFEDLNLIIGDCDVLGIVGPNGSGKTTLKKCIDRILKPKGGILLDREKSITVFDTVLMGRIGGTACD